MKNNISRQNGFTLVEIMIVVAIIGLLATIAVPNYVKARLASRKSVCIANLKQINDAKTSWALENRKTTGDTVAGSDLFGADKFLREKPACAAGGSYTIQPIDVRPTCNLGPVEGHSL